MSKKMMWKMTWRKVRYGLKSYLFFLIITILFVVFYFLSLFFMDDISDTQNSCMITFLYIPVLLSQSFQAIEYSKCYYLIPRTMEDRKRFIRYQNKVKVLLSILILSTLFVIGVVIRPEAIQYLFHWYLLSGLCVTIATGCNGYSTYLLKKKKSSYVKYMVTYSITVVIMSAILFAGMFLVNKISIQLWMVGSIAIMVFALAYNLFYYFRFRKVEAIYENIDKDEQRVTKRIGSAVM